MNKTEETGEKEIKRKFELGEIQCLQADLLIKLEGIKWKKGYKDRPKWGREREGKNVQSTSSN